MKKKLICDDCGKQMDNHVLHARKNGKEVFYCGRCSSKYIKLPTQEKESSWEEEEETETEEQIEQPQESKVMKHIENKLSAREEELLREVKRLEALRDNEIAIQQSKLLEKDKKKDRKDTSGLINKIFKKKTKAKEEPIIFLRNNGVAQVLFVSPEANMYEIEGRKYHQRFGCDWDLKEGLKSKKIKIIPEWGMYPLGTSDYLEELKTEDAQIQFDMIHSIQTAETVRYLEEKKGKQLNPKLVVLGVIALIVVGYFIFAGGGG